MSSFEGIDLDGNHLDRKDRKTHIDWNRHRKYPRKREYPFLVEDYTIPTFPEGFTSYPTERMERFLLMIDESFRYDPEIPLSLGSMKLNCVESDTEHSSVLHKYYRDPEFRRNPIYVMTFNRHQRKEDRSTEPIPDAALAMAFTSFGPHGLRYRIHTNPVRNDIDVPNPDRFPAVVSNQDFAEELGFDMEGDKSNGVFEFIIDRRWSFVSMPYAIIELMDRYLDENDFTDEDEL